MLCQVPRRLRPFVCLFALAIGATPASAADPPAEEAPAPVSFYRDIRPILQEHCQGCHQPAKRGGGMLLTSFVDMQQGGDSGLPAVTAGDAANSLLLQQISGAQPLMPKDAPPLSPVEIDLIARWIGEGAQDDTPAMTMTEIDAEHPPVYELPPVVTALDYSPDGALLAVSGYHEVLLHKADGSELVARLIGISERIESAVFSPDGKYLAVTGGSPGRFGELQIWDVANRSLAQSISVGYDTIYGASWSSDGRLVAFGCADNTVRAVEAATGAQVLYQGAHSDWVLDTVFSTDDSHLISVSRDRSVKLIQVATQQFIDNVTSITPGALKGGLQTLDRHPTRDEILIGGADGTPKIYQVYRTQARQIGDDFNKLREFAPLAGRLFDAAYNSDGSRIVVGSSNDGTGQVRVYNEADAALVAECAGPLGPVYSVAFRPDDLEVAAAGFDGVVRFFDPSTGQLLRQFLPVPLTPRQVAGGGN